MDGPALKLGSLKVNKEKEVQCVRSYYTETVNINATGRAVGVGGPFMVIPLLGNNQSQLLPNLLKNRACFFLPVLLFGQNHTIVVKSGLWGGQVSVVNHESRKGEAGRKTGLHLPSSLTTGGFDSCLVQFL